MSLALATVVVAGCVGGVLVLRAANNAIRSLMQRALGDYFEYASMFYLITFAVVALLAFTYFVVPLVVWLAMVLVIVIVVIALMELN